MNCKTFKYHLSVIITYASIHSPTMYDIYIRLQSVFENFYLKKKIKFIFQFGTLYTISSFSASNFITAYAVRAYEYHPGWWCQFPDKLRDFLFHLLLEFLSFDFWHIELISKKNGNKRGEKKLLIHIPIQKVYSFIFIRAYLLV